MKPCRAFANWRRKAGRPVGILLDTQGPAIRTGDLKTDLRLKPGDILEFTVRGARSEEKYSVDVNYEGLVKDISVGDTVLVDNGMMRLQVLEKRANRIRCKVLTPGTLGSRRHINLPGVRVNLPPLTKKDILDVTLGVEVGVDFVALSFVREKSDLEELRRLLMKKKSKALIVAKIEDQSAVHSIEEIIRTADAIMVARGDLGIEMPMEELPIIQRRIVKMSLRLGKPVVVATHMLESMIHNPMPTRAEITDVANAVYEQADALMLSGETSGGQLSGGLRAGVESRGPAHRAKRRRRLREVRHSGRHAAKDGGFGRGPGQLAASRQADRFYPARHHGAQCFQSASGACADFCLHAERRSAAAIVDLLGSLPGAN